MEKAIYSPYKAVHHIERLSAGLPVHLQLDLTNICNYNCGFCSSCYAQHYDISDSWPLEAVYVMLRQAYDLGVRAITMTGGGEPLCYPHFALFAESALQMGFQLGLITNGSLLLTVDSALLRCFSWIRVSINAITETTFALLHNPRCHCDIWNITETVANDLRDSHCTMGASFVVQSDNIAEMYDFALWARSSAFRNCRFTYEWTPKGVRFSKNEQRAIEEQMQKCLSLNDAAYTVFPMSQRLRLCPERQYNHCYYSDLVLVIAANMAVYRCCALKNTDLGMLGSLKKDNLASIWRTRTSLDVAMCPPCWMDKKNSFIEYMLASQPAHVDFV